MAAYVYRDYLFSSLLTLNVTQQATAAADSPPPGSPWLSSMEQGADSRDSIAWSSETTLSLLDKVQEEEAIWDTRHPSYYKKNLKRAVYEELCSKMKEEHASLNKLTAGNYMLHHNGIN